MLGNLYLGNALQTAGTAGLNEGRLDSWKQIASFFGREVRTVQLWEKSEGLPVWRHHHRKLGTVYAYRAELEAWQLASSRRCSKTETVARPQTKEASLSPKGVLSSGNSVRIALVPFQCLEAPSEAPSSMRLTRHFSACVAEELTIELGRLNLQTVPILVEERSSQGTASSCLKKPVRDANADAVFTGTVRCCGDRVRISVRLLRPEDLSCIWSERFDTQVDNLLESQTELASRISASIPLGVLNTRAIDVEPLRIGEDSAHQACLMGRFFWKQRDAASLRKALRYFEQAVSLNPEYPPAYAGLADCYVSLSYSHLIPTREAMHKANWAAESLLRLNKNSAETHNCLANLMLNFNWNWAAAERECSLACEHDLNNSRGMQLYSILMATKGRHQQAIRIALKALQLDPLSKVLCNEAAYAHYYAGDFKNALYFVQRSIELDHEYVAGYALLGMTEMALENHNEALAAFSTGAQLTGHSPNFLSLLACVHARQGDRPQARILVKHLEDTVAGEAFPAFNVAAVYLALQEKEEALLNLRRAHTARDLQMICLKSDPRFEVLSGHPAFQNILASMQLS